MNQLPNVAFIGKAGAGKTQAAEMLTRFFGYERLSFAAPLKIMLGTTTDRARMQEFGTDVVRAYEPDAWVNLFVHDFNRRFDELVNLDAPSRPRFVVDDARFQNEIFRLRLEGFVIVRIVAHRNTRLLRLRANGKLQDESQLDHSSETELDDVRVDYNIINEEGPEELFEDIRRFLQEVQER